MQNITCVLKEKLLKDYSEDMVQIILEGYKKVKYTTLRVNSLKYSNEDLQKELSKHGILYQKVDWYEDAFVILNSDEQKIRSLSIYQEGKIYLQNLSSMLPPLIVEPREKESILDMTAAPGGKTTQMACLSNNLALITAVEKDKIRTERLRFNLQKQGANRVTVLMEDASKLDEFFRFDKVLLDAPCSGSGTINLNTISSYKNFNNGLVLKSIQKQKELLKKAAQIVKEGGEIIYSTCSILKEENEQVILELLSTNCFQIIPIDEQIFRDVPKLPVLIPGVICVCPNEYYEGFFVAKLKKIKK